MITRYLYVAVLVYCTAMFPWTVRADDFADRKNNGDVTDQYIVVLQDNADPDSTAQDMAKVHSLDVDQTYTKAVKGYSAYIPKQKLEKVKKDSRVKAVVPDRMLHKLATSTGQSPSTGFARIGDSLTKTNKGTGIGVAVLDTGIDLNHPDLKANIIADKSCVRRVKTGQDDDGHGTHVAGIIAAVNNSQGVVGVAPEAKLIAVKVLNSRGDGPWSNIICGLDWAIANAAKYNIKVVNLSLGDTGTSDNNCGNTNNDPLHKAVCRARDAGITIVVAAGNEGLDAVQEIPASYDDAVITVSALADSDGKSGGLGKKTSYNAADDTFVSWSNFGSVVDIAAPGVDILSTWKGNGYKVISGTSMATPFISGSAALYIKSHPGASWQQVRNGLVQAGEKLNQGHTDPSRKHPEPVVFVTNL